MEVKQRKRVSFSLIFMLVFLMSVPYLLFPADVYAKGTREDAVAWALAQEGKGLDYDGYYGNQCVDLIKYYYRYLGVEPVLGNGGDYAWNALPEGWTRTQYWSGMTPSPGDIAVWGKNFSSNGHVAIVLTAAADSFVAMDQNWGVAYCKKVSHNYNRVWGFITPDFENITGDMTVTDEPGNEGDGNAPAGSDVQESPDEPEVLQDVCNCDESYAGDYIVKTNGSSLTIRSGHGTKFSKVGSVPNGVIVSVELADKEWAHVEYKGVSGYCSMQYLLKLDPDRTASISVSETSVLLKVKNTWKLKATVTPKTSTEEVMFASDNKKVVSVSKTGKLKGKRAGNATVTVSSGTQAVTVAVQVNK